jgi:peptide deformylase
LKPADIAKLQIIDYPDPRLRQICKPIEDFDETVPLLAERMLELMHGSNGIGLAGPQVGVLRRLFVSNITGRPEDDQVFVNPTLSSFIGLEEGQEGCLSLPDVTVTVRRGAECEIQACDVTGRPFNLKAAGLMARCWQHEYDHLDGRMIVDYMSESDKIANRRTLKHLDAQYKRRASTA